MENFTFEELQTIENCLVASAMQLAVTENPDMEEVEYINNLSEKVAKLMEAAPKE